MRFVILFLVFNIIFTDGFCPRRPTNIQSDYLKQLQLDSQKKIRSKEAEANCNIRRERETIKRKDMDDFGPEFLDSAVPSDVNWYNIEEIQNELFRRVFRRNMAHKDEMKKSWEGELWIDL